MKTKEDREQDHLAIMRWETVTGPTQDKNKRPGLEPGKTPDLCTTNHRKMPGIRIVNITAWPGRTLH